MVCFVGALRGLVPSQDLHVLHLNLLDRLFLQHPAIWPYHVSQPQHFKYEYPKLFVLKARSRTD